ncbi:methyltransferase [Rhizobium sp. NPDC090275]|uniref:methyltransferase n=1 Tax=Rhizobium sp. NPDC090275 TaxID=3364498 RepID=UPI000DDDAFB4
MSRIYKDQESIDALKVRDFFNGRARKEGNAVNAVMLQSEGSTIAVDRDIHEKTHLLPRLERPSKILELGCGAGRLARFYNDGGNRYLGFDFSEELIARAEADIGNDSNIQFQAVEVPRIAVEDFRLQPPFDVVLITGLFMYLNDEAVHDSFEMIAKVAAPNAAIYVRESLSELDVRLTLKEHFSEELDEVYNAIYRTTTELTEVMTDTLVEAGFEFEVCGEYAFPLALRNRAETAQRYFTLRRG